MSGCVCMICEKKKQREGQWVCAGYEQGRERHRVSGCVGYVKGREGGTELVVVYI